MAKHSAILDLDVVSQRLFPSNPITMSCIVTQIVPLKIDKDGGMFCGGVRNLYPITLSYNRIALPGF